MPLQEPQGARAAQQQEFGPCSYEIKQFLECAQSQSDVKLCEGFNEVLRQCRIANGRWFSKLVSAQFAVIFFFRL